MTERFSWQYYYWYLTNDGMEGREVHVGACVRAILEVLGALLHYPAGVSVEMVEGVCSCMYWGPFSHRVCLM